MTLKQNQFFIKKFREKRKFLLEYAESSLRNHTLSERAVQQTFKVAHSQIEDFYNSPNPDAWLIRTLTIEIRNIQSG